MLKPFKNNRLCFAVLLISVGLTAASEGRASATTFAQACSEDIEEERKAVFYAELDKAEAGLVGRDPYSVETAARKAHEAVFRGGTSADDTSIRCLGPQATRRWVEVQLELWRRGSIFGLEGRSRDFGTMTAIAHDRGAQGLVETATNRTASGFSDAYYAVTQIIEQDDWRQAFGSLRLPEEKTAANAARAARIQLDNYRQAELDRTLVEEEKVFKRPLTDTEKQHVMQLEEYGKWAGSIAGEGNITSSDNQTEMMLTKRQTQESLDQLKKAQDLEWGSRGPDEKTRSALRAEKRGDILLARASDESRSLELRDDLYQLAGRYFVFCSCHNKRTATDTARMAIQPALDALHAQRKSAADRKKQELSRQAEAMQQAADDMKKTEAEKKSFEKEADALEQELGF